MSCHQQIVDLARDTFGTDDLKIEKAVLSGSQKNQNYIPQSAVALRCRVIPPPCLKNPYLNDNIEIDMDPFGSRRSKFAGNNFAISLFMEFFFVFCFLV